MFFSDLEQLYTQLNEEREFLESSVVERSSEVHSLDAELKDAEEYGKSNLKFLEEQRQSNLSILCANDSTRVAAVQLAYEEDQQSVAVSLVAIIALSISESECCAKQMKVLYHRIIGAICSGI